MMKKRLFQLMKFTFKVYFLSLLVVSTSMAQSASEQAVLSNQVQELLKVNDEIVDLEEIKV